MDELNQIKQKKLEELQKQMGQQAEQQIAEETQIKQQIEQLESIVKTKLTKEALERYGNIRAAHPEKAVQALIVISQLMQTGQAEMIDDTMLKKILRRLTPQKREFKIRRK